MVFTLETSANILPKRCILPQLRYCKIPTQLLHVAGTKSSLFLDKQVSTTHCLKTQTPFIFCWYTKWILMVFVSHSNFAKTHRFTDEKPLWHGQGTP